MFEKRGRSSKGTTKENGTQYVLAYTKPEVA